jgi:hypothetical protein
METIDTLYTANIFSVKGTIGLTTFESVAPPSQWQMIRHLHISTLFLTPKEVMPAHQHFPPDNFTQWPASCHTLKNMRGLRSLQIEIIVWDFHRKGSAFVDEESLELIFEPLNCISVPYFEVEMNMQMPDSLLAKLGQITFNLVVRQRPFDHVVTCPL